MWARTYVCCRCDNSILAKRDAFRVELKIVCTVQYSTVQYSNWITSIYFTFQKSFFHILWPTEKTGIFFVIYRDVHAPRQRHIRTYIMLTEIVHEIVRVRDFYLKNSRVQIATNTCARIVRQMNQDIIVRACPCSQNIFWSLTCLDFR